MSTLRAVIFMSSFLWVTTVLNLSIAFGETSGFLSIDCGSEVESYVHATTNIAYISDSKLMEFGKIKNIDQASDTDGLADYLRNVRTFPEGNRTCYRLPVIFPGFKYLLRTSFFYGNFDGFDSFPKFDLYLENAFVNTVSGSRNYEFIVKPTRSYLALCLCKTNERDDPFISAIELRPIPDAIYPVVNGTLALTMLRRSNFGARNFEFYRYPDDPFDRFWNSPVSNGLSSINTSLDISLEADPYKPPLKVMQIADFNPNSSDGIYWDPSILQDSYLFMCIHFAELEKLEANETRKFKITVNQDPFGAGGPITPSYLKATYVCSTHMYGPQSVNYVLLSPTEPSNLSPILNAAELYAAVQLSSSVTDHTDIHTLLDIRKRYNITKPWSGDPCLPLNYTWDGLVCSNDTSSPRVISLDLSNSGLNGEMPTSLANLTALVSLNLAINNLTGSIPDFLAKLTQLTDLRLAGNRLTGSIPDYFVNLTQLTYLDLSDNNLNGSVPDALLRRKREGSLKLRISGNEHLCSSGVCDMAPNEMAPKKARLVIIIGQGVLAAILCFLVVSLVIVIKTKKSKLALDRKCTAFTFSEVVQMTDNFKEKIGEGGYGTVFHGHLSGQNVAVKILADKSKQGSKEFQTEIVLLSRVHHRNLVSFLGYCDEAENMILVYEFLPKGNLRESLSGRSDLSLDWNERLKVAFRAAQGLDYLHSDCSPGIVHGDVKSANILLNERLEAKIADFGMSKADCLDGITHISTKVVGTPGYLDPEYYLTDRLNEKSDVFSFGIVLLELICGLRPIITEPSGKRVHIVDWIRPKLLRGALASVADPRFCGVYDASSMRKVAEIALECTASKAAERPTMSVVVSYLKEAIESALPTIVSVPEAASESLRGACALGYEMDGGTNVICSAPKTR